MGPAKAVETHPREARKNNSKRRQGGSVSIRGKILLIQRSRRGCIKRKRGEAFSSG